MMSQGIAPSVTMMTQAPPVFQVPQVPDVLIKKLHECSLLDSDPRWTLVEWNDGAKLIIKFRRNNESLQPDDQPQRKRRRRKPRPRKPRQPSVLPNAVSTGQDRLSRPISFPANVVETMDYEHPPVEEPADIDVSDDSQNVVPPTPHVSSQVAETVPIPPSVSTNLGPTRGRPSTRVRCPSSRAPQVPLTSDEYLNGLSDQKKRNIVHALRQLQTVADHINEINRPLKPSTPGLNLPTKYDQTDRKVTIGHLIRNIQPVTHEKIPVCGTTSIMDCKTNLLHICTFCTAQEMVPMSYCTDRRHRRYVFRNYKESNLHKAVVYLEALYARGDPVDELSLTKPD